MAGRWQQDSFQCAGVRLGSAVLLLVLLTFLPATVLAFQTPRMKRYVPADGLPSRQVVQLAQDGRGFVWAATPDGLVRIDSQGLRVWQHAPGSPGSLPGNDVEALAVDAGNRVWMGINGKGLVRLDADGTGVHRFPAVEARCGAQVWTVATQGNTVWVGGNGTGICLLHDDGTIEHIGVGDRPQQLRNGSIYTLRLDPAGRMWIGTLDGLFRFDNGHLSELAPAQFAGTAITRLNLDSKGRMWVGNRHGLWRMDARDRAHRFDVPGGMALSSAHALHDLQGALWLGTTQGLYLLEGQTLQRLEGDAGSGFLSANSVILDMLADHEGGLWFATASQGLAYLAPHWRRFSTRLLIDGQPLEELGLNTAAADGEDFLIAADRMVMRLGADGQLRPFPGWEQISDGGVLSILKLDSNEYWLGRTGRITRIGADGQVRGHLQLDARLDRNRVDMMTRADDGTVWISVIGMGIEQRDRNGRLLRRLRAGGAEGLPPDLVHQLRQAPDGALWLATGAGVYRWDGTRVEPVAGIAPGEIYDLVFAWRRQVWIARSGRLERYAWEAGKATLQEVVGPEQGMPPLEIGGIQLGDGGQVWATTARGLLLWEGRGSIRQWGYRDGLVDVSFLDRPPARTSRRMLALSQSGLTTFSLDMPPVWASPSPVWIDSASIRRRGSDTVRWLPVDRPVVVEHGDYDLDIQVRLQSFAHAGTHAYRYRLEGLDASWRQAADGHIRLGTLPAGDYVLMAQAHGGNGQWVQAPPLVLQVLPVWWASPAALLAWSGVVVLLGAMVWWQVRRRQQHRERLRLSEQRCQMAEEASHNKSRFLATLGHEVRTPMTGVLGMSELLLDSPLDAHQRRYAESIRSAGQQLLLLLDDALDTAGLETGQLHLVELPFALAELMEEACAIVRPRLQSRGLVLRQPDTPMDPVMVTGDRARLRQLMVNLLLHLARNHRQPWLGLVVHPDPSGQGLHILAGDGVLPSAAAPAQAGDHEGLRWAGGELGLAICRQLATAMGGRVEVLGTPACGLVVAVRLPLGWAPLVAGQGDQRPEEPVAGRRILLVEDDPTVSQVIDSLLAARGHQVTTAAHALQALTLVMGETFDIGLLDLDLPGMDGMELARQLRGMGISIPLLAVSARQGQMDEQVRDAGMNGFVRKPVTGAVLAEAMERAFQTCQMVEEVK